MNILITGGAGFLGANLTKNFLKKGHQVTVVDTCITGSYDNITRWNSNRHFNFYNVGIETNKFLSLFLNSPTHTFDQIYHLACPTGVPNIEYLGEEMLEASSAGTKNVLNIAKNHHAAFLYTSSSEVYGAPTVFPQGEEYTGNVDPQGWRASYEEGKRFSEALVSLFVKKYRLNAKTVRLFNVYGPYMSTDDQRVIPRFIQQALKNEPITVYDNVASRTFCYVDDIIKGIDIIMEEGQPGDIFNLGSDEEISMYDLAQKIIKATQSDSDVNLIPATGYDHQRRLPSLRKMKLLNWNQSISFDKGLKKTIAYFKKKLVTVPAV